jgi:tRNA pseudouridine55 synthase
VLLDKPKGCTSHDMVNTWRRLTRAKKAGHLGTLDPMATGLLLLAVGKATRLAQFYGKHDKTYEAEIQFGATSDTYDVEGEVVSTGAPIPEQNIILQALQAFRGRLSQIPPRVSAKKIEGVPAYKLARRKESFELLPVEVEVKALRVDWAAGERIKLLIQCSVGTYIRSLAHDLGQMLGCGAVLSGLRRIASGEFHVSEARTVDELRDLASQSRLSEAVVPASQLLPQFPSAYIDEIEEIHIRQGRQFRTSPFVVTPGSPFVKAISFSGELISIGQLKFPNVYHPMMVL